MGRNNILSMCQKTIDLSYHALFFLTPLLILPWSHELFEFPKMMFVYLITGIILIAFAIRQFYNRDSSRYPLFKWDDLRQAVTRLVSSSGNGNVPNTKPLDVTETSLETGPRFTLNVNKKVLAPIPLFLAVNLLSTLFSIHKPTSFFGYYSRFNGGLLSLMCYAILFYIFIKNSSSLNYSNSNLLSDSDLLSSPHVSMYRYIDTLLFSTLIISIYGFAQHFGIDEKYWQPNVKARVFSTLGQPNWLATYLAMLFPLGVAMMLLTENKGRKVYYLLVSAIIFACFWFTYSLSGILGLSIALTIFAFFAAHRVGALYITPLHKRYLAALAAICILIMILFPGMLLIRLKDTISGIKNKISTLAFAAEENLEAGPGHTGNIRLLVWKGAVSIVKNHPILGTGPETFAYSFLPYRPKELNQTTEWAFLYNKAHNEYLNVGACTGLLGLVAYLWLIYSLGKSLKNKKLKIKDQKYISKIKDKQTSNLHSPTSSLTLLTSSSLLTTALFAGWVGSLVSNFFGFSVVCTSLLFWMFPALAIGLSSPTPRPTSNVLLPTSSLKHQASSMIIVIFGVLLLATATTQTIADVHYSKGESSENNGDYLTAIKYFEKAARANPFEQAYTRELAFSQAKLGLIEEADKNASKTFAMNPYNMLSLKSLTRTYFLLGEKEERFWEKAEAVAKFATNLCQTDPQASYNLATIYYSANKKEAALKEIEKALKLKPDYPEAQKLKSEL